MGADEEPAAGHAGSPRVENVEQEFLCKEQYRGEKRNEGGYSLFISFRERPLALFLREPCSAQGLLHGC